MLTLEWPWVFALAPLPLLVYFLLPREKQEDAALHVPFLAAAASLEQSSRYVRNRSWLKLLTLVLIWACLLLASARPVWVGDAINLPAEGRDLLLAVDISGSMATRDMQLNEERVSRLATVKDVVGDFVERRTSDRLGLVLFGSNAYLQTPLTFDRDTVNTMLQEAELGYAGERTAIGDAIGLSVKRLRSRPKDSRVLILLTDGANTAGNVAPLKAAELAQQSGVKIYTIGIGADVMLTDGIFGTDFGRRRINPSADLDEETLTEIANSTGGRYFRARSREDLQQVYLELDKLEPIEQEAEVFRPSQSLYFWPLAAGFLLSLLLAALGLMPSIPRAQTESAVSEVKI